MTPDGHGGSLRALVRSGAVAKMEAAGIDVISYFQVDNPIIQCIDPAFIGFHVLGGSELSSKMVPKAYALEKVGHFCVQDGVTKVIEYSDMPDAMQEELMLMARSVSMAAASRSTSLTAGSSRAPVEIQRRPSYLSTARTRRSHSFL